MIAIAMIGEAQKGLLDLGEATGWKADLYTPALRERLEDLDGRFSLVAESLRLERTMVASFFRLMNEKASAKAGRKVVIHDEKAVLRRCSVLFPDPEKLNLPYEEIREDLTARTKQIIEASRLGATDYVKGIFFPMDLVEKVMTAIAVPNTAKAIERELQRRALLRGSYLAFAIAAHRSRWGKPARDPRRPRSGNEGRDAHRPLHGAPLPLRRRRGGLPSLVDGQGVQGRRSRAHAGRGSRRPLEGEALTPAADQ